MGGGGKGSSGNTKTTIRYAPYIEDAHKWLLNTTKDYVQDLLDDSPFDDYTEIVCDAAFFGTGYTIASFPSLYDMYGKFMAGLDVDVLYDQTFSDTVNSAEINSLVAAEAELLDDDIDANVLPRFQTGMRDINSVMSSSFVVGKALIEDGRDKNVAKFSAELKYRMIPVAVDRWKAHLAWNQDVIKTYNLIMQLYFSSKIEVDKANYNMIASNTLWPFTVLEFERIAVGTLNGATNSKSSQSGGGSTFQNVMSGVMGVVGIASLFL